MKRFGGFRRLLHPQMAVICWLLLPLATLARLEPQFSTSSTISRNAPETSCRRSGEYRYSCYRLVSTSRASPTDSTSRHGGSQRQQNLQKQRRHPRRSKRRAVCRGRGWCYNYQREEPHMPNNNIIDMAPTGVAPPHEAVSGASEPQSEVAFKPCCLRKAHGEGQVKVYDTTFRTCVRYVRSSERTKGRIQATGPASCRSRYAAKPSYQLRLRGCRASIRNPAKSRQPPCCSRCAFSTYAGSFS
ncbi:hypothetical protein BJ546DRAFT_362335 [Cryomyces antarcticus]